MIETAVAQLRYAAALALGRPFHLRSLDRLCDAVREPRREFGAIGADGAEMIGGPALDDDTRRAVQLRRFRAQARRAARETAHYAGMFDQIGLDPARLRFEDIARIPPTTKDTLCDHPHAFVRRGASPVLCAMTTGTTGRPTMVHYSAYELQAMIALSTLGFLLHRQLDDTDIMQISTGARGTLGNLNVAGGCARIGAAVYLAGVVDPAIALAMLAEQRRLPGKKPQTSALTIYPSYLGELVEHGRRLGYRPADFGLERVFVGGEVVTDGLKARARELFGPVAFETGYAMTETIPFGGHPCGEGHLHFDPSQGLLEVINPETGAPAGPGAASTIVATPFAPYRDTTLLLRYDTEDVVRPVAGSLTCSLRTMPATSNVLGKLRLAVRHDAGWTYPRDVLEALEASEDVPLPARCGFWAVPGGVAVEVVTRADTPEVRRAIERRLGERGVPVRALSLVDDPRRLRRPLPLRCDLKETSFNPSPATAGLGR